MNYRKPFFVLLAGVLLLSAAPGRSQTFENPSIQGSSSFAVITDSRTARECRPQMTAYKQTLEAEGLPVYIVSHDWTTPEQVRDVLRKLYAENALEGCVFIGDVPIAMITKAQHLTSAFKMDERDHPLHETSVPSDRFYDDFDLQFVPQGTPSQGLFHYYEMSPDSPQYISCDIYSGRIKAQKAYGDPYKQIARYLEKAVAEHRDATPFDQFVSYTGHGSYSNSLIAWRDEQQLLDEQFGNVFSRTHNAKFLRYSMQPFVKESLIREVRRDDVDMMVFHEHGMPHRQYLSGTPYVESAEDAAAEMQRSLRELARRPGSGRESAAKRAAEKGLDSTWYNRAEEPEMLRLDSIADLRTGIILEEVEAIAPNARFVVFDACYNGDYREDDFIAGHYIMAPGRCVTTFANSVNVLQDKSAFDLLGLLGEGLRIGAWAKNIHILESHVIGDPTYRFKAAHPELDINSMALKRNNGFWLGQLDNAIPDIQNLAMIRLWENDYPQLPAILLDKCSESPYSVVRYNAFRLLESLNGPEYKQALMLAAYDRFEFLRRIAVTRMGRIGDEAFISVLIDALALTGLVVTDEPMLGAVYGGVLNGAGYGLIYTTSTTGGGTDIVAKMLRRRYPYINFGTLLFGMNVVVVLTFAFLFKKYDSCMYTMIEMFISSKVVNLVLYGPGVSEVCYIITNNVNAIKSAITCTMGRGVTLLRGEGAWSGKEMQVILCVVKRPEIAQLREVVRSVDEHAFVIVSEAKEVFGRGFGNIYGDD